MTLKSRKELDDLICDEVNVKMLSRYIGLSEKGQVDLVYIKSLRAYHWHINGIFVKDVSEDTIRLIVNEDVL